MKRRILFIPLVFTFFCCFDLMVRLFSEFCISRIPEDSNMYGSCVFQLNEYQSDLLILGASKAMHHYDVKMLEDSLQCTVYNMGSDGQNIHYQYMCLLKALDNGPVNTVIVDISYNQISKDWEKPLYNYHKWFYWKNQYAKEYLDKVNGWWEPLFMASACLQFNTNLVDCLRCLRQNDKRGYKGYIAMSDFGGMFRDEKVQMSIDIQLSDVLINYLDEIVELCKENNINLILCQSPCKQRIKEFDEFIINYSKENEITYWDLVDINGITDNNELFYDANHLTGQGADMFTEIIMSKIMGHGVCEQSKK